MPILPRERDPRLITLRRGGTLTDEHHRLLAEWALGCAEHVLRFFEDHRPDDGRPRAALEVGRAWIRGEAPMREAHQAASRRTPRGAACPTPRSSPPCRRARPWSVAHVAAHDLGAAAYAIRAAGAAVPAEDAARARADEREWQRAQLPDPVRELVLDDQQRRSAICWHAFDA